MVQINRLVEFAKTIKKYKVYIYTFISIVSLIVPFILLIYNTLIGIVTIIANTTLLLSAGIDFVIAMYMVLIYPPRNYVIQLLKKAKLKVFTAFIIMLIAILITVIIQW